MKKVAIFSTVISLITVGISSLVVRKQIENQPFDVRFRKAQRRMREEIV